ncbi:MAG TPA: sigma-70 family RNA polymerase sigma factor [Solirubrobacteraceae bacterium]|nr:sigma-70 family RNA polymerase sigma factor [Solirubrobacteraceae bacterium]
MEASALRAPASVPRICLSGPLLRLRSDDQLVALFRAGNDDAFGAIHDRYRQRLFGYMRQMLGGSRYDAEDAAQDVFMRAYSALRADDRTISLRAWLYRVAHNRCIDQLRRPVPTATELADVSRRPLLDPPSESEQREQLRRLVSDIGRLPEAQRSVLLMRELNGLSYAELADAADVTVPAIKSLLVRARAGLVQAAEARDAGCSEIRAELALAHGRGVRGTGRSRRHLRDCAGCRDYRVGLRSAEREVAALIPGVPGPIALVSKLFGAGSGGGSVLAGGNAGALGTTKLAALICTAAVVTGGGVGAVTGTGSASEHPQVAETQRAQGVVADGITKIARAHAPAQGRAAGVSGPAGGWRYPRRARDEPTSGLELASQISPATGPESKNITAIANPIPNPAGSNSHAGDPVTSLLPTVGAPARNGAGSNSSSGGSEPDGTGSHKPADDPSPPAADPNAPPGSGAKRSPAAYPPPSSKSAAGASVGSPSG